MSERYEIIADPIEGGMGVIYICKALQYGAYLAFKGLNKRVIDTPEAEAKLQREAEIWLDLAKHPNILPLRFTCDIGQQKFLVMDAILPRSPRGNTLASWIKTEIKLDLETTLNFSIQICNGMIHATKEYEKKGRLFIHGDLHPGNILIQEKSDGDPIVKITDFGLVRDQETWSQKYMGTFQYTACERWNNAQEIDQRADIYSFGCLIYLMITGHPPFNEMTRKKYHQAHCGKEPDPPFENSEHETPGVNELTDFVLKCLKKNPEDRYFDFDECRVDLMRYYWEIFGKQIIINKFDIRMNSADYFYRGLAYVGINHPMEAEKAYRKTLEIDPKYAHAWNGLGVLLDDQGRFDEAEKALQKAIEINPKGADSWTNLGVLLAHQGRFDEAEKALQKTIEINPNDTKTWHSFGLLLADQKRPMEAEEAYRKSQEIDPKYAPAWNGLGVLLADQKRPMEAEEAYHKALEIDRKYVRAWNNLGLLLADQKRLMEAEDAYRKALEIDPKYTKAWHNLGTLLADQNRLKEAEEAYRKALEIDPKYVNVWNNLGNLLIKQNRLKEAEEAYRKALEIDPKLVQIWYNLGTLLKKQNRLKEAENIYRKTLGIDSKYAGLWTSLGIFFAEQRRYKEAEKIYQKILAFTQHDANTYYNLACLYGLQSKVPESVKFLKLAIDKGPKYKEIAWTDKDFDLIRDTQEFQELLK